MHRADRVEVVDHLRSLELEHDLRPLARAEGRAVVHAVARRREGAVAHRRLALGLVVDVGNQQNVDAGVHRLLHPRLVVRAGDAHDRERAALLARRHAAREGAKVVGRVLPLEPHPVEAHGRVERRRGRRRAGDDGAEAARVAQQARLERRHLGVARVDGLVAKRRRR